MNFNNNTSQKDIKDIQRASLESSDSKGPVFESPVYTSPRKVSIKESPEGKEKKITFNAKSPLKRTYTKSSLKKSKIEYPNKLQRQYTFVSKKKKNFFEDDENSSDKSINEVGLDEIPKLKKPTKPEIYDALVQQVPNRQVKVIKGADFSATIDTTGFSLRLKKENGKEKPNNNHRKSNSQQPRVRSGSILDNMMKH